MSGTYDNKRTETYAVITGARMAYAVSSPLISEVKPGRLG